MSSPIESRPGISVHGEATSSCKSLGSMDSAPDDENALLIAHGNDAGDISMGAGRASTLIAA